MKVFYSCSLTALLVLSGPLANAQNKKSAAAAASAATPSAPASSPSSSAAFESQMLSFGALNHIAKDIAQRVCSNDELKKHTETIIIFDQASFANVQAYQSFLTNARLVVGAYNTLMTDSNREKWLTRLNSLADQHLIVPSEANKFLKPGFENHKKQLGTRAIGPTFGDPISDAASLLSALAVSSNTEAAGSITIPDSALALAITQQLKTQACSERVVYPPLFGSGSLTDASLADIQVEIQKVDDVRSVAHQAVEDSNREYIMEFPSKPHTPASPATPGPPPTPATPETPATAGTNDTILASALTDIDGLYDNLINALLQVNSSTGITGSASVIQGRRLATLLTGKLSDDKTRFEKAPSPAYILLASVVTAGGTTRIHKTLWTALSTGDKITYSGGAVVSFSLWNINSQSPIFSENLRYRSPFMNIRTPSDTDGLDVGDNLSNPKGM